MSPPNPNRNLNRPRSAGAGGSGASGSDLAKQIQSARDQAPYDFLPIDPAKAIQDSWVPHDGSEPECFSGEILCELETLTPLLVANEHYPLSEANDAVQNAARALCGKNVSQDKKVLEPLRLPDGRVVIAGTSLKGMLRPSLAALLQAPMERVAEQTFSYRPNLDFEQDNPRLAMRAAIVDKINGKGLPVSVKVLPANIIVYFGNGGPPGASLYGSVQTTGFQIQATGYKGHVKLGGGGGDPIIFFKYVPGIDGEGRLARMHAQKDSKRLPEPHRFVAVKEQDVKNAKSMPVPEAVMTHYGKTLDHLSDARHGHLREEHPLHKAGFDRLTGPNGAVRQHGVFEVNQLIYVEVGLGADKTGAQTPKQILSFGHHFHYRWRYRDTVRTQWNPEGEPVVRAELSATEDERNGKRLSAARLLFGYAGAEGVASPLPEKLAGRIACNMALEVTNNPKDDTRFLGDNTDAGLIPLKVLGQPRASAVEFYLQQDFTNPGRKDASPLRTYGDLILTNASMQPAADDPAGELRGRKVYRHQQAATNLYRETDQEVLAKDYSVLARYVMKKGSHFRFTVRFRDLRRWEVGALLAVLEPQRLAKMLGKDSSGTFAHKLGYARPLGWGSVKLTIKHCRYWQDDALTELPEPPQHGVTESRQVMMEALKSLIVSHSLDPWFKQHRFSGNQQSYCYPSRKNKQGKLEIFGWHTNVRRQHSKLRRTRK